MGCSNSGGSGGVGKHGGGMLNNGSGANVLNSHPLTDEIDKGKGGGAFANEIMNTRDAMEREYGDAVKQMALHVGTFDDASVLGAYGDNTLYMNQKYIRNSHLTEAMQNSDGFHPGIGNKTGAEAVASHEIGHRLGEVAAKRAGISEKDIVARAGKKIGVKTENVAGHISGYARTNYSETIAEAMADVYCNGSKASKASIAISNEVKNILKKGR